MRALLRCVLAVSLVFIPVAVGFAKGPSAKKVSEMSDGEVKRRMIDESIAEYPGPCPCPYNTARNGSSCGKRSAWSRPGGYSPLCYPSDISAGMVSDYRASHAND